MVNKTLNGCWLLVVNQSINKTLVVGDHFLGLLFRMKSWDFMVFGGPLVRCSTGWEHLDMNPTEGWSETGKTKKIDG